MNLDETLRLIVRARIDNPEMNRWICSLAHKALDNNTSLPEDIADLFTLEVVTRPSGSRYGILDFA